MPQKNIKRVLIANRGEIAVRIIRALRELEIESVAIYSDADKNAMHVLLADYAYHLPGTASKDTYLHIPKLCEAIKTSQADAVHPGYGFLSENEDFARKVQELGASFIGPNPDSIRAMGEKTEAKKLVSARGVPTLPGSKEALSSWEELKNIADKLGFPLILKAAAGGGGKGMRVVRKNEELKPFYEACSREAQDYFGNPAVFCERYIEQPRHVEIQVLFDQHGHGIHLFERDCTIQRRHQKLIEEAPSTYLNSAQREKLGKIAVEAAKSVNYVGAGTVEFICNSPDEIYFMEMNTRIQVEHPVTEMITGIDLVKWQIRIARGEKLTLQQSDIKINGHAVEARINAEDPFSDFMPVPGVITGLHLPLGPSTRIETHIYEGYEVPAFYDSMIAKFICHGENRAEALTRLRRALHEFRLLSLPTTASFHEVLCQDPRFIKGEYTTRFLESNLEEIVKNMRAATPSKEKDQDISLLASNAVDSLQTTQPTANPSSAWEKGESFFQ